MTMDDATARALLDDERERLVRDLRAVEGDLAAETEGGGELSTYDQHPAEMGTEVQDESRDLGLRTDLRHRLQENDAARRRIDDGRYGICERCGNPIGDERLRAMPSTRYCVVDQQALGGGAIAPSAAHIRAEHTLTARAEEPQSQEEPGPQ